MKTLILLAVLRLFAIGLAADITDCSQIHNAICTRPNDTSGDWDNAFAMEPYTTTETDSHASLLAANLIFDNSKTFTHPGMLHTEDDFTRVISKVNAGLSPWTETFDLLASNSHAQASWKPSPQVDVYRGDDGVHSQNYPSLYRDIAAAYQNALM